MLEGRTRLCAEDTQYAWCEGGIVISTGSYDVSCGCLWSQEQARSLFFVLHLPFTFPWGFIPPSPLDGLIVRWVCWGQAGTAQVCGHHLQNWRMMDDGMWLVLQQACSEVSIHMNGCNGFVGLKENKIKMLSVVGQKAQNLWFSPLKSWLWVGSTDILSW